MNYLEIDTLRFKNNLLATVLNCFIVSILVAFPQNVLAKKTCVEVEVCKGWKLECTIGKTCIKVCIGWIVKLKCTRDDGQLVDLISFNAIPLSNGIVSLEWETSSEKDTVGFNIWRAQLENDNLTIAKLV